MVDICKPHRGFRGSHFMVPRAAAMSALLSEDLTALNAKGCFSLPSEEVRERLLQCYCHYVHPFLPIIDLSKFLHQYESGGPRKVNLLLLWSMFFASTNVSLSHSTMMGRGRLSPFPFSLPSLCFTPPNFELVFRRQNRRYSRVYLAQGYEKLSL